MTIYYVATTGSDSAAGSSSAPWRTINKAMSASLKPGDEVVVRSGTYAESVSIYKDGSSAGQITLRSEVPGGAVIAPPSGGWNGISVSADYVTIDGFTIRGARGDGIEGNGVHHVRVLNNTISGSGESGIQFNQSDVLTIEGNETFSNASSGWFSGISVYQNRNLTNDAPSGFRNIIRDNISHDNVTKSGAHTDGNGIILDDFRNTQNGSTAGNYAFKTLVENNLVYENGGKGIQVFLTDNVTVRNNTAAHNNQDLANTGTYRGELSNQAGKNNVWVNNIAVADTSVHRSNTAVGDYGPASDNSVWANNVTFNGTAGQASLGVEGGTRGPTTAGGNLLGIDPQFVNLAGGNFNLKSTSPAVNAGTSSYGVGSSDLDGGPRVVGVVDIGALETGSGGGTPANVAPVAGDDSGYTTQSGAKLTIPLSTLLANDTDANGDSLTITGLSAPSNGSASLDGKGNVVFTPTAGATGAAGFTYTVSDGKGGSDTGRVSLTITGGSGGGDDGTVHSLWSSSARPSVAAKDDGAAVELGVRFVASVDGEIEAIRFYKGTTNGGVHTARLWTDDGQRLVSVQFGAESAQGWQQVNLPKPIEIEAGETYIASYHAPQGHYAFNEGYFNGPRTSGPLTATDGVYKYGAAGSFPSQEYRNSNYWVDVVFDPDGPGSTLAPANVIKGDAGANTLNGTEGSDEIFGYAGRDRLSGAGGDDRLDGGLDRDVLIGGAGSDRFVLASTAESRVGSTNRDVIRDFSHAQGDRIDLVAIDANTRATGDQAFSFIGGSAYSGTPGELRYSGGVLQGDVNGDKVADFEISLTDSPSISAADLIL